MLVGSKERNGSFIFRGNCNSDILFKSFFVLLLCSKTFLKVLQFINIYFLLKYKPKSLAYGSDLSLGFKKTRLGESVFRIAIILPQLSVVSTELSNPTLSYSILIHQEKLPQNLKLNC